MIRRPGSDRRARRRAPTAAVGIDRLIQNIEHGRFERALSALTAIGAGVTGAEIWLEHDRASFANRMMWLPVALTPVVSAAAAAGVFSKRMAKTVLPVASALVVANSLQGQYLHLRGSAHRPGGLGSGQIGITRYNLEMGPPTFAPLLFAMVGGMGLLAAMLRREND